MSIFNGFLSHLSNYNIFCAMFQDGAMPHVKSNHMENEIIPVRPFTGVRMELNLKERQKLTTITAKNYRSADKKGKTKILEVVPGTIILRLCNYKRA